MTATADIRAALRRKYAPDKGYVVMEEVRNHTGFTGASKTRSADMIVVGVWPSRGLTIHGIEIKASRSDWLRELEDPSKAEAFAQYCDRWSVVTAKGVVDPAVEDIPPTWTVTELRGKRLVDIHTPTMEWTPTAMPRPFLVSLLRAGADGVPEDEVRKREQAAEQKGWDAGQRAARQQMGDRGTDHYRKELEALRGHLSDFKETTGIDIEGGRIFGQWVSDRATMAKIVGLLRGVGPRAWEANGLRTKAKLLSEAADALEEL